MADAERSIRGHRRCHLSESAIGLIIFFASLVYFNSTIRLTLELRDEGFLLCNIARVAHGEIPHRDFAETYGPGFYALTAPILQIFGDRLFPIRELVALVRAAAVAFAYLIARRLVSRSFALVAAFLATVYWGRVIWNLTAPYAALFTISLCMLSLILFLRAEVPGRRSSYLWSGFVCGGALLFKWSLAAVSAYGMVLAICAHAMLRGPEPESPRTRVYIVLLVWLAMGMLIVLPFLSTITAFDYLLHFAPIHALVALVAVRFERSGDGRGAFHYAFPRLVRYSVGFLIIPICVGALYLWWGSLDDLFYNMVYRPLRLRNYRLAIGPPEIHDVLHLVCLISWIGAGLALVRGARLGAALCAVLGCILLPAAVPALTPHWNPSLALQPLMQIQLAGINFAVLFSLAWLLTSGRSASSEPCLNSLIAVLFFQEMMTFQIFPRASYNVVLMLGTLAPATAWLCYRVYAFATIGSAREALARRVSAFALSVLLPLLLVGEIAYSTLAAAMAPEERALHSPALAGVRPMPNPVDPTAIQQFDELIEYLETLEPLDAPVFSVPIDGMIYFASGRDQLFEDHALALFLTGWDFLPEKDPETPSAAAMIRRLRATPEAIVIRRLGDRTEARFDEFLPSVSRYIDRHYRVESEIGEYRVLRWENAKPRPSMRARKTSLRRLRSRYIPAADSDERRAPAICPSRAHPI